MQLDHAMLQNLLKLSDREFEEVIRAIAKEAGIDPAALPITQGNIATLRMALRSATPEDLNAIAGAFEAYRKS